MIEPKFYLNKKLIKQPINYKELSIELNFDKDDPSYRGEVSTNKWTIGLGDRYDGEDGSRELTKYINDGLIGGVGVFEGIPFRIDLRDAGSNQVLFDGYLDLTDAEITCSQIKATAVETGRIDWLNKNADAFTFDYLYDGIPDGADGKITFNDYVNIPYLISEIPDYQKAAILGASLFSVVFQFLDQFQTMVEKLPEAIFASIPNIVSFILRVLSLILLVVTAVVLIVQLIKSLVQVTKFHAGMYLRTLCDKGAEYLGYEFQSTILDGTMVLPDGTTSQWNHVALLPESYTQNTNDDLANDASGYQLRMYNFAKSAIGYVLAADVDGYGFYNGTYGDFLRAMKDMFNAKLIIEDNPNGKPILRLERVDYGSSQSSYVLEDIDRRNTPYRFNTEDFNSVYKLSFISDQTDRNSLQEWLGTETQIISAPKRILHRQNLINTGEKSVNIPFARGVRNKKKGFLEKMFSGCIGIFKPIVYNSDAILNELKPTLKALEVQLKKWNGVLKSIGVKIPDVSVPDLPKESLSQQTSDLEDYIFRRSDALLLETEYVTTPKLVMMEVPYDDPQHDLALKVIKLHQKNDDVVNSLSLYNGFHSVNSFVGSNPNQYKIYTIEDIPFCLNDYNKVKNNNMIKDSDGITNAEIISLKWNVYSQTAQITYKVREKYTDNLKETIISSDGR